MCGSGVADDSLGQYAAQAFDFYNKKIEAINSITADDIYTAARHIFNSKPIYSITATKDTLKANEIYLKSLEN